MSASNPDFLLRLAETDEDIRASQHLRYQVFVQEMGGDGPMVDHDAQLERDKFDPYFDHLMLLDQSRGDTAQAQIVGVYRLLRDDQMPKVGQFYTEDEYDLSVLKESGRKLLELGRSCLAADYRGGTAMYVLWNGLADYVRRHEIEILFGTASFHGTDLDSIAPSLSLLHHRHLAPKELRVRTLNQHYTEMNRLPYEDLDRKKAMLNVPALIKGYLRLGGFVGEGAYVDQVFNTTDVCLVMDTERLSATQKKIYSSGAKS
ncbi:GNAT family N-acetyltransferase [Cognatishimia sp.]|uniref:GNAT family N-acetyltransferase n=1 Tax=Cognatishimia sp. TaxID=2211648 RepID=UPI003511C8FB|nr:GNAT family N-acetyltransferase [Cognatishimia sp.]